MTEWQIRQLWALYAVALGALTGWAGHPIIMATIVATAVDLLTGVAKAAVLHRVESGRFGRGLYKIVSYMAIGTGLLMIGRLSSAALIASNALAAAFLFREFLSNVENLHVIGLAIGVEIPAVSLLVRLLRINVQKLETEAAIEGSAPRIVDNQPSGQKSE